MAILLQLTIVLVPLLIAPGFLFYFDVTPKIVALLTGTSIALLWLPFAHGLLPDLFARRLGCWLAALLAAQLVSLAISTAISPEPALSLVGTNWRRFGALVAGSLAIFTLILAGWLSGHATRVRVLLRSISAGGTLAAVYGIAQYFGWDPWIAPSAYHIGEGEFTIVRPPSTLGYANYAATYLLHVVFAGVGLILIEERVAWKSLGSAAVLCGSLAIVLSGTRAALLGLAVGAILLAVLLKPRVSAARIVALLLVVAGLTAFYVSPAGQKLRSRVRWSTEDVSGGARPWLWRDSLRMAAQQPLVGRGPETFTPEFPRFQSRELARAYPDFYQESPHNIFLDAFAAQGIPGVAILLALCAVAILAALRAPAENRVLAAALAAAFLAALASEQFVAFIMPTALYFYVTVAMLVALTAPATRTEQSAGSFARVARMLIPVAVVPLLLLGAWLLVADRLLFRVQEALRANRIEEAARLYERVRAWQPSGASADLWYSRALAQYAQKAPNLPSGMLALGLGFQAAERATAVAEDRQNAYYNLAQYYALRNDAPGTERSLHHTILRAPNWFKPHWTLAQVLRLAGRWEEAEAEAALAADLAGGKHPEVAQTLAEIRAARGAVQK